MKYDVNLVLAQELYQLYCEIRKSLSKVELKGAESSERLIKQELSDCILGIWCAGYLGYKRVDYRSMLKSMDSCRSSIDILYNARKVSYIEYLIWSDSIQKIKENLTDVFRYGN